MKRHFLKITDNFKLDAVHVVPGDARNKLVEELIYSDKIKYGVVSLYSIDSSMASRCEDLKVPYICLGLKKQNLLKSFLLLFFFVLRGRPKMLFMHSFYPSILGVGIAITFPFTKVISVRHHNQVHLLLKNRKALLLDQIIAKVSFHNIAVSKTVRDTMVMQGCNSSKVTVILNGVRLEKPVAGTDASRGTKGGIQILAVGRLDWQKNYEFMLAIAKHLKNRDIDFELTILGTGSQNYTQYLLQKTDDLDLNDNVNWLGWESNVLSWLKGSDLLLHTALDEACPLILIEALLAGLPVVASGAGGSEEILQDFHPRCPNFIVELFAEQIISLSEDIEQAKLKAQSKMIIAEDRFGAARMRDDYETFTLSILCQS